MLDAAWRNLVVTGRAFQFKEIDVQSIPFEEETFEAILANHMLYHVPDRPKGIAEIKRVLKPGGRLFATTVGKDHMKEMMDWYRQVHTGNVWESLANPFLLENGLEQLAPFFSEVNISRYEDNLQVTELEAIMAYIRSGIRVKELSEKELANLQLHLQQELKKNGRIFISKDSGLFEAVK
jgi:SAM-dependent methyltransferase